MISKILLVFIFLTNIAGATDFGDVVERYVKINQDKIDIITAHRHRIKGVEIIIADKAASFASRFGHGMLRLIDDDETWVNDAVISFSALSYEEKYSIRKSIFGGYSVTPQVMTLYEFWNMYTEKEERDLKRYVIKLDGEDLEKFLDTLFKHLNDPTLMNDYTFLSNNCIGIITRLFVEAGVTKSKKTAKIPTGVSSWIEKNELSVYPEFVMKNYAPLKARIKSMNLNDLSDGDYLKTFTTQELSYIYFNNNELNENKIDFLAAHLKQQGQSLNVTYGFNPIHFSLYSDNKSEQMHLEGKDLLSTIIFRLENNMTHELNHLKFQQKVLASHNLENFKLISHSVTTDGGNLLLSIKLRSAGSQQNTIQRKIKIPAIELSPGQGLAVIKNKTVIELKLISL